jgi:glycosyltransferase involved in cell wall biosynthesis
MHRYKNTIVAAHKLRVQAANLFRNFRFDLLEHLVNPMAARLRPFGITDWIKKRLDNPKEQNGESGNLGQTVRPSIFVSYATDESLKGSHRYCGGEKALNNLVLLLRRHGYDAYMVSWDGAHSNWLVEHAPFLSLEEFSRRAAVAHSTRHVTSWVLAEAFLQRCPRFYFWDQELASTARSHFPALARLTRAGRIVATAGVNRSIQAWHMAIFERRTSLLRNLLDEKYWKPDDAVRKPYRVGYMDEGPLTDPFVDTIKRVTLAAELELEFFRLEGIEAEIIRGMQTCSIFLALNVGKSPLWGEGGPLSLMEAGACGAVPICFDVNGPWELIQQGYNGVILPEIRPELMAEELIGMYRTPGRIQEMSRRCIDITMSSHTMESRWPAVRAFLDLPEET